MAPTPTSGAQLAALRGVLASAHGTATTVGYGPRFLHSTGQLHKGGPAGGMFIQLVDTPDNDVLVPESGFTFKDLITAQAAGDRAALLGASRILVSVDLGPDVDAGLMGLNNLLRESVT